MFLEKAKALIKENKKISTILFLAIALRLIFWYILPPVWKMYPAAFSIDLSFMEYCGDFIGYQIRRMPFYDWISGRIYLITRSIIGLKGLTLLSTSLSIISLPLFYKFLKDITRKKIAIYGLIIFSFYPKLIYTSARGMPEAVSVSLIVISLYYLNKAKKTENKKNYFLGGVFATFAYLAFLPALLYLFVALILILEFRLNAYRNIKNFLYYSVSGIITIFLHWFYGPLGIEMYTKFAGESHTFSYMFSNPETYSFLEKVLRFIWYSFIDFWWHTRGFDNEMGIQNKLKSVESIWPIDQISFPLLYSLIILILTIPIFIGIIKILREKINLNLKEIKSKKTNWYFFFILIFSLYWLIWIYQAFDKGDIQTRHIFPQFPFFSIIWGVGLLKLNKKLTQERKNKIKKIIKISLIISLITLSSMAIGEAYLKKEMTETRYSESTQFIQENNIEATEIGVISAYDYKNLVLRGEKGISIIKTDPIEDPEKRPLRKHVIIDSMNISQIKQQGIKYIFISGSQMTRDHYTNQNELLNELKGLEPIFQRNHTKGLIQIEANSRIYYLGK